MNILLITHVFLPEFSGGTEVLTYSVANDLRSRGHEVLVLTGYPEHSQPDNKSRFDEYLYEGIRVVRFTPSPAAHGKQRSDVEADYDNHAFSERFTNVLDTFQPEIVYCFHMKRLSATILDECSKRSVLCSVIVTDYWYVCPVSNMMLEKGLSCPGPDAWSVNCLMHLARITQPQWVNTVLSLMPDWILINMMKLSISMAGITGRSNNLAALATRKSFIQSRLNQAHTIYFATKFMMERFIEQGIDRRCVVHLPFGINQDKYVRRIRTHKGKGQAIVVAYIGQALPHKGLDVLIKAFLEIPRSVQCELRIYSGIGEKGGCGKECQNMAMSDSRVRFLGRFENNEIATVMNEIDVVVIPSVWSENMPLVLLTAQSVACPVIASDIPGISEVIIDNKNGLLFPAGNYKALHQHLLSIIEQPELLERLSRGAARNIKTITQYVDALMQ